MRQHIRRVDYLSPAPFGVEVMTLADLRAMAPPGYLRTPQRPTFHVLLLGTSGAASHQVDFQEHPIDARHGVWVRPGQVQRFSEDPTLEGEMILFRPDFLLAGTQAASIAADRFGTVSLLLDSTPDGPLGRARRELTRAYATATDAPTSPPLETETLAHLLSVLILRLSGESAGSEVRADGLYADFRQRLEDDFAQAHDVEHYARALGYSARTLARATQAGAGQSPKQMIQERLALEAGRLLAHSDSSVAAVAATLGFRDPANFSSFFQRRMGVTPLEFRRVQRGEAP